MMNSKRLFVVLVVSLAAIALGACSRSEPDTIEVVKEVQITVEVTKEIVQEVEVTKIVEKEVEKEVLVTPTPLPEPVTYYGYQETDIPTLDPQVGQDVVSIDMVENLFVHLTNYDLETAEIIPEAATSWEISEDGLTYTFNIRTDIPWVKHNPVTGETVQDVDGDGNPRFVTARDFAYGIKRACDPNIGSYYSSVIAPQIKGCADVLNSEDPGSIAPELVDAIGVSTPDDATLVIELEFPAGYFLSMTPMWTLAAVPQWTIEEFGTEWAEAGNIVTNGRYLLDEWVHGVRWKLKRNPFMPADMWGSGNVDQFIINVVPDPATGYALFLNNDVDYARTIPDAELEAHLANYPDETDQVADLSVFYISFRMDKPPFDDPQVRRAFSAAFDREKYVSEVRQGQGLPMIHFAPPGIFGAPPIDEVGLGFDPEYAREQLAAAGYPNCEGFPSIALVGDPGQNTLNWIEFAQVSWAEHLGCSTDLLQIEQMPFRERLAATAGDLPSEQAPHMWTGGWGPDYADENNWVGDVLWCENSENRQKRTCNEIDDLITEARVESEPQRRIELYRQIEEKLFGYEGETPFFPVYLRIRFVGNHSWLDRIPALFGGQQYYMYTIDQAAQQAAKQ